MGALGKTGIRLIGLHETQEMLEGMKLDDSATYRVKADTDYAVYVEFGTRNMPAQPYMRPAVNQTMREADRYIDKADSMDEFVEMLANKIADRAQDRAPVDTGTLRDSITVEKL